MDDVISAMRIPLLSIEDATAAATEVAIPEPKPLASLYRVLLHQPKLAKRVNDLIDTLMLEATLEARQRELIIMRIGWLEGCVYTWTHHWRIAQAFGVSTDDLLATRDWEAYQAWSDADRVALRATDETLCDGVISPGTWADVVQAFPTEAERLELVTTISGWAMMSGVLRNLAVPLEDGVARWPPDDLAPSRPGRASWTSETDREYR